MVGLIPLFAVTTFDEKKLDMLPAFNKRFLWFIEHRSDLCGKVACMETPGEKGRRILALLNKERLQRVLQMMLDENEFLSPYGIRSVSKYHRDHPFTLKNGDVSHCIDYEPGESTSKLFGGNSNWRGPVWMPLNYLIIESLQKYHYYYGDTFKIECPTGSGNFMTLNQVAQELSLRLMKIFERDSSGNRPVFGGTKKFHTDPFFKDFVNFYEYYHGEDGSGLGASHQTGWSALVAKLIQQSNIY